MSPYASGSGECGHGPFAYLPDGARARRVCAGHFNSWEFGDMATLIFYARYSPVPAGHARSCGSTITYYCGVILYFLVNKRVCVVMALYNPPKTIPSLTTVATITFFLRETAHFYRESAWILANLTLLHSIFPAKVMIFSRICSYGNISSCR